MTHFSIGPPPDGSLLRDVLTFFGGIIAAGLAYLGVRGSQRAPQQTVVNAAWQSLIVDLQKERSALVARVSELEQRNEHLEDRLGDTRRDAHNLHSELTGEIANLRQHNASLLRLSEKQGASPIPPGSLVRIKGEEGEGI